MIVPKSVFQYFVFYLILINTVWSSLAKLKTNGCIMGVKPKRYHSLLGIITDSLLKDLLNLGDKADYLTSTLVSLPCPDDLDSVNDLDDVQFIARNTRVKAAATQINPPNDGLARISHRDGQSKNEYLYTSYLGQGVDVYILDSGINTFHEDFDGRAASFNFVTSEPNSDLYGHGSHVSGIIGGRTYGVAKKCNLKGVKILDRVGAGDAQVAIEAITWVIQSVAQTGRPSIINLSLEGETNLGLNFAIQQAYSAGIPVIGAAGNSHQNACSYTPASSPYAFAVGSIDRSNRIDSESNYGSCVRLFAPGDKIVSTGNTGTNSQLSFTGTSQAAPHVAGIAAIYLSQAPNLQPKTIYDLLVSKATPNLISGNILGSPNLIAYSL